MANVEFNPVVEGTKGALSKGGLITRQKTYRDQRGRIIAYGKQEGYFITNPRSFKHNPMVGKELEHHNLWRDVCAQAKEELADLLAQAHCTSCDEFLGKNRIYNERLSLLNRRDTLEANLKVVAGNDAGTPVSEVQPQNASPLMLVTLPIYLLYEASILVVRILQSD